MDRKQQATACTSQHKAVPFRDLVVLGKEVETKARKKLLLAGGWLAVRLRARIAHKYLTRIPFPTL